MTREQAIAEIIDWIEGEECDRCITFYELRRAINVVVGDTILDPNKGYGLS